MYAQQNAEYNKLYQEMVASIKEDVEKEGQEDLIEITEETGMSISVWDNFEMIDREYTITNPNCIGREYLRNKLIITPSVSELPFIIKQENILSLLEMVDKRLLMTLEGIVLCNDAEADFDYLRDLNDDFYQELEVSDIPCDGLLGINWYCYNKVLVNAGEVFRQTLKLHDDGYIYDWEIEDCIEHGIVTTLIHELRHLEQSNPYIPRQEFQMSDKETHDECEEDAENYARDFCNKHDCKLIYDFKYKEIEKLLENCKKTDEPELE